MKKFSKYLMLFALLSIVALVTFVSCDDATETAKADFWVKFKAAVNTEVEDVAEVTYTGDDITVVFVDEVDVQGVKEAAEGLFKALGYMVDSGELTLDSPEKETFDLDEDGVVEKVARHLLGDQNASGFLGAEGVKVTSPYSAKVKYKDVDFTLKGTLIFDIEGR